MITPPEDGFATATDSEVQAAINAPLVPGEARVMYCGTCGAEHGDDGSLPQEEAERP